jgi:hypothetical protein
LRGKPSVLELNLEFTPQSIFVFGKATFVAISEQFSGDFVNHILDSFKALLAFNNSSGSVLVMQLYGSQKHVNAVFVIVKFLLHGEQLFVAHTFVFSHGSATISISVQKCLEFSKCEIAVFDEGREFSSVNRRWWAVVQKWVLVGSFYAQIS